MAHLKARQRESHAVGGAPLDEQTLFKMYLEQLEEPDVELSGLKNIPAPNVVPKNYDSVDFQEELMASTDHWKMKAEEGELGYGSATGVTEERRSFRHKRKKR